MGGMEFLREANEFLQYVFYYIPDETQQEAIIQALTETLCKWIRREDAVVLPRPRDVAAAFYSTAAQPIGLAKYIEHLVKRLNCSPSVYVVALLYLRRLEEHKLYQVNHYSVHRMLLAAVTLSTKYLEDKFIPNTVFAQVGGVGVEELNMLELQMLCKLNFRLHVDPVVYAEVERSLFNMASGYLCSIEAEDSELDDALACIGVP